MAFNNYSVHSEIFSDFRKQTMINFIQMVERRRSEMLDRLNYQKNNFSAIKFWCTDKDIFFSQSSGVPLPPDVQPHRDSVLRDPPWVIPTHPHGDSQGHGQGGIASQMHGGSCAGKIIIFLKNTFVGNFVGISLFQAVFLTNGVPGLGRFTINFKSELPQPLSDKSQQQQQHHHHPGKRYFYHVVLGVSLV